jgi:hypothetical protein
VTEKVFSFKMKHWAERETVFFFFFLCLGLNCEGVSFTDLMIWVVIFGYVGAPWKINKSFSSIEENKRCGIF